MFEDIKGYAGKYAPPSVLSLGLSGMIFRLPNQTQLNWPIIGEFVMDDALKAILIAIVWFLFFSGWAAFKKLNPSYPQETRDATNEAREILSVIVHKLKGDFYSKEEKKSYLKDTHTRALALAPKLQSDEVQNLFLKCMVNASIESIGLKGGFKNAKQEFDEKTNWIRKQ